MDARLQRLLKRTSRSMHLSLSVLPAGVRGEMGLAYLLCRAADTIADTPLVPKKDRLRALERYRDAFSTVRAKPSAPSELSRRHPNPAERQLLESLDECVGLWRELPEDGRAAAKEVVFGVVEGMRMDLEHFPGDSEAELRAFDFPAQLDRYCAYIGGAPGRYWTRLCRMRLPDLADVEPDRLENWGFQFGKGLQMTNILRDVAQDLRIGRCYFPMEDLRAAKLSPKDLLDPANISRFRTVLLKWTGWALEQLEAGEAYVRAIPGLRLRAAVAWPLLLSLKTLQLVERSPDLLRPDRRVKVSRSQVYGILAGSPWTLASNERFARKCADLRMGVRADIPERA